MTETDIPSLGQSRYACHLKTTRVCEAIVAGDEAGDLHALEVLDTEGLLHLVRRENNLNSASPALVELVLDKIAAFDLFQDATHWKCGLSLVPVRHDDPLFCNGAWTWV